VDVVIVAVKSACYTVTCFYVPRHFAVDISVITGDRAN